MSIHIHKFVDRLRGFEAKGSKDFIMSLADAKALHADITKLLVDLQTLKEATIPKTIDEQNLTVQIQGGSFK